MQYYCPTGGQRFTQPGLRFMQAVRLFDPQQAKCLTFNDFFEAIAYLTALRNGAKSQTKLLDTEVTEVAAGVKPFTFWLSNRERFPNLCELAIRYLSVPCNSVDAERSVSQYNMVNAPQRQSFSDDTLALQVMMVCNAKKS